VLDWFINDNIRIDDVGDVLDEAPEKVSQSILLFSQGLGLFTSLGLGGNRSVGYILEMSIGFFERTTFFKNNYFREVGCHFDKINMDERKWSLGCKDIGIKL